MKKIVYHFNLILGILNLQPPLTYASAPAFHNGDEIVDMQGRHARSFGELYQSVEHKFEKMLDVIYMTRLAGLRFKHDNTDNVFDRALYWLECLKPVNFPFNWSEGNSYECLHKLEIATAALLNIQNKTDQAAYNGKTYIQILQNIEDNLDQLLVYVDHNCAASLYNEEMLEGRCVSAVDETIANIQSDE